MKYLALIVACLALAPVAGAQELGPETVRPSPGAPMLAVPAPAIDLATPELRARRARLAAISLAASGAALTVTGGLLMGLDAQSDGGLFGGITFLSVGGAALVSGIYTGINAAGRESGVHELRRISLADPAERLSLLDAAEHREHHRLLVGAGVLVSGLVLFGVGTGLAIAGVGNPFEGTGSDGNGSSGMFAVGIALSVSGDVLWATGTGLMVYHGGKGSALRAGRSTVSVVPTGVMGTF